MTEEAHQKTLGMKACKANGDIPVGTESKSSRPFVVSGAIGSERSIK